TLQIFATCPVVNTFFMAGTPVRFEPCYGPGRRNAGSAGGIARPPGPPRIRAAAGKAAGGILPGGVGPVGGAGAEVPIAHTRFGEREAPPATRGASLFALAPRLLD